jgi:hypothetical protein
LVLLRQTQKYPKFCVLYVGRHQLAWALNKQISPHLREWVATEPMLIRKCDFCWPGRLYPKERGSLGGPQGWPG